MCHYAITRLFVDMQEELIDPDPVTQHKLQLTFHTLMTLNMI